MDSRKNEWVHGRRVCLAACVMLGCAATAVQAGGTNQIQLSATVQIGEQDNCDVEVGPPSGAPMAAKWVKDGEGKSSLTVISTEPPSVRVKSTGGANCSLNNLALTVYPGANLPSTTEKYALLREFETTAHQMAYWRFIPYLAQARFYTGEDYQTGEAAFSDISVNGPDTTRDDLDTMTFQESPSYLAGHTISVEERDYKILTNQYAADGGAAVMVYDEQYTSKFFYKDESARYQSAVLSFGALLATDPDGAGGNADPDPDQTPLESSLIFNWQVNVSVS